MQMCKKEKLLQLVMNSLHMYKFKSKGKKARKKN